ncbi:MAG: DUF2147 domain-containing protein [Reyranella sp.]|uniref:DUF2147 domain-containing protein n=1 Tax=Reyranella sp. TaxID=1929291 RepID=UPI001ACA974F|nr:DUF2147 domain-containing protein [Reyranella sp.]MBN9088269.1 DUF2147 domain-containing protein [Reyranella sp.]
MRAFLALTAALSIAAAPAAAQTDVLGRWATPGVSAVVELARCGDAQTLCGTIHWLWDAVDARGRPRPDANNTDQSLRTRPMVGLSILSDLKPRADGWSGQIHNPEDGQTYRATLRRVAADTLEIEGCVLVICRKQIWRRASALAEALR